MRSFQESRATAAEWTHAAHLVAGLWYVHHYGEERALSEFRDGILRLNAAHGTPNSDTRGYHETITRAYLRLIAAFLATCPPASDLAGRAQALLASPIAARGALLAYYSEGELMSVAARRAWREPDRAPLPVARDRGTAPLPEGERAG